MHSGEQAELVSEVVLEALLGDRGDDELSGAEHGAYERLLLLLFYRPPRLALCPSRAPKVNRCGPCRVKDALQEARHTQLQAETDRTYQEHLRAQPDGERKVREHRIAELKWRADMRGWVR